MARVSEQQVTYYEAMGGHAFFDDLVAEFYRGVASAPPQRAHYPEDDLTAAADRLRMFLEQYWGGPRTYSDQRGHPRLRMRHVEFHIDEEARDAWLRNMHIAVGEIDAETLDDAHRRELLDYFDAVADFLINVP